MNKSELVASIATSTGLNKSDSEKALSSILGAISETLAKGESVSLVGFGSFSVTARAGRTGRNPQTGKPLKIAAKKVAKFKPGKALVEAVN